MKTKFTIACALALLSLAGRVFAQVAPSPVTGVAANTINGQIVVQWDEVGSDPIDYYRVYYSGQSILNNNGLYDDFEITDGDQTTLSFVPPQGMTDLYIAVIAVAKNGLESEFFTEEVYVKVPSSAPSVSSTPIAPAPKLPEPVSTPPEIPSHTSMKLLKGEATSPEEITVEFSTSITVDPNRAPEGLKITKADGSTLQITSITISGKTVTIHTVKQERGRVYNVRFAEPFAGKNGQLLDHDDRSVFISGHKDGREPTSAPTQIFAQPPMQPRVSNPTAPPDIVNPTIVPQIQQNGAYTITVEWQVDNGPGDLYGIVAYQTRDGVNFGPPSLLPVDIRGVQLQNVTPGFFGIYLQTVNVYGYVSPGVFQYVTLPTYIPGYGFYGDLTFGNMKPGDAVPFDTVDETTDTPEGGASLDAITEETPVAPIEGVDHSAAMQMPTGWKNAGILAGSIAGVVIVLIGGFALCAKKNGSCDS